MRIRVLGEKIPCFARSQCVCIVFGCDRSIIFGYRSFIEMPSKYYLFIRAIREINGNFVNQILWEALSQLNTETELT